MPVRQPELGKRKPWVRRPGVREFPPWDGTNLEGDPASIKKNQFRNLINVRIDDSEIRCRGGQRSLNPGAPLEGCVTGIWPPEFPPGGLAFKRLLIGDSSIAMPTITDGAIYAPDETPSFRQPGVAGGIGLVTWYFDGERILWGSTFFDDTSDCAIGESLLITENGLTVGGSMVGYVGVTVPTWVGTCGGISRVGNDYYFHRYLSTATATQQNRLEKISFAAGAWVVTNERNNDETANLTLGTTHMVMTLPDQRLIWLSKSTSVAAVEVRSQSGVWASTNLPSGFLPSGGSNNQAWAFYNGLVYMGGKNGADAKIVTYDPVTNISATARTFTGCDPIACMAVHKGVLYVAYKTTGGAWRIGMLSGNVWTDAIISYAAPLSIYDMASFQGRLYVTRNTLLEAATDPNLGDTFETIGTATDAIRYLVAVP